MPGTAYGLVARLAHRVLKEPRDSPRHTAVPPIGMLPLPHQDTSVLEFHKIDSTNAFNGKDVSTHCPTHTLAIVETVPAVTDDGRFHRPALHDEPCGFSLWLAMKIDSQPRAVLARSPAARAFALALWALTREGCHASISPARPLLGPLETRTALCYLKAREIVPVDVGELLLRVLFCSSCLPVSSGRRLHLHHEIHVARLRGPAAPAHHLEFERKKRRKKKIQKKKTERGIREKK